jgi:hypothetical protein
MSDIRSWREKFAARRALLDRQQRLDECEDGAAPEPLLGPAAREAALDAAAETHRQFVADKWARQLAVQGRISTFDAGDCPCFACCERASERVRLDRVRDEKASQAARQARRDAARGFAPPLEDWELP